MNGEGLRQRGERAQDAPLSKAAQAKLQMQENLQVRLCALCCLFTDQHYITDPYKPPQKAALHRAS